MATYFTSSHVGTLSQSGKDFNILASNVPFEMLSRYDTAVRNGSSSISLSTYDISQKISNSLIICAPQVKDDKVTYTYWTQFSYVDNNDDEKYTYGEDSIAYNFTYTTISNEKKSEYKDYGQFELAVTDVNGVPVCITPQFNDIDTSYFKVVKNLPTRSRNYCESMSLTLSDKFGKSLGTVSETLDSLISTYTPIVPSKEKTIYLISTYNIGDPNNKQYYVGYTGKNGNVSISVNGGKYTYSYTYTPDKTLTSDSETTSFTRVSFTYLLDWNIKLQEWKNSQFNDNDNISDKWDKVAGNSVNQKISYLLDQVTKLMNYKYMFRLDGSSTSYMWTGTKKQYEELGSQNKRIDTTFVINDK